MWNVLDTADAVALLISCYRPESCMRKPRLYMRKLLLGHQNSAACIRPQHILQPTKSIFTPDHLQEVVCWHIFACPCMLTTHRLVDLRSHPKQPFERFSHCRQQKKSTGSWWSSSSWEITSAGCCMAGCHQRTKLQLCRPLLLAKRLCYCLPL